MNVLDLFLHIDVYLGQLISTYGLMTYLILFAVIFVETGLVFTPFLPGDSLLFAAGAFAALGALNIFTLLTLLTFAAILGDNVNYWVGYFFGKKVLANPKFPINKSYISETQKFFAKHGAQTIILARFVPIVRTFSPFIAGVGKMNYSKFLLYDIFGGVIWVFVATLAGYFFGNIMFVKENFSLVVVAIVLVSVSPMLLQSIRLIKIK